MQIDEYKKGDVQILAPVGRLDTNTSREFEAKIAELVEGSGQLFVIDFSGLEYVSSAGLRVLILLGKRLASAQGRLVLCSLSSGILEVMTIAGFDRVFTIVPNLSKALDEVKRLSPPTLRDSGSAAELPVSASVGSEELATRLLVEGNEPPPFLATQQEVEDKESQA